MPDLRAPDSHQPTPGLELSIVAGMVLLAALSRLLPHPWNFSPLEAMALFAGARIANRWFALLVPLAALLVSDLFLGFYPDIWVVYACFAAMALAGRGLRRAGPSRIAAFGLGSALGFFAVTNFAVWAIGDMYPPTGAGLATSYISALPFLQNQLAGVACYSLLLFGGYALLQRGLAQTLGERGRAS